MQQKPLGQWVVYWNRLKWCLKFEVCVSEKILSQALKIICWNQIPRLNSTHHSSGKATVIRMAEKIRAMASMWVWTCKIRGKPNHPNPRVYNNINNFPVSSPYKVAITWPEKIHHLRRHPQWNPPVSCWGGDAGPWGPFLFLFPVEQDGNTARPLRRSHDGYVIWIPYKHGINVY